MSTSGLNFFAPARITHIVRNDGFTLGRDRKFQNELILRIGQTRSPREVNVLTVGHPTQKVYNADRSLTRI